MRTVTTISSIRSCDVCVKSIMCGHTSLHLIAWFIVVCLVSCPIASATTTGSIRGVVCDVEGSPLAGATVIIKSLALIGSTRSATTNQTGVFHFPYLPVGKYSMSVVLESFETVEIDPIDVGLDTTVYLPIAMKIAKLAETVNVIGESRLIDVTDSSFSNHFKDEMLERIPTQRNFWDLIQISPGMSPASEENMGLNRIVAYGSNDQSNSWSFNGLEISSPGFGTNVWIINPDILEEVQVLGVGAPAEYGN